VEGRLQIREYEDKGGNQRIAVEVVASKVRFLGRGHNGNDEKRPVPGQPKARTAQASDPKGEAEDADSVPF
jgi:single-stranded DNA-binding protein